MSILKCEKILSALRCPMCQCEMGIDGNGSGILYCVGPRKHCYDFASSGYINLAGAGKGSSGDSKQAVRARSAFLDAGYYAPIAQKLCELLKRYVPSGGLVIDAGCGEGYYSNKIAANGFFVAGFDLSKFAVDAAAKRAKRDNIQNSFFGAASVFSLPIDDESADAVVNIFAPCVENEYSRVMCDGGSLIVVHAGPEHLLGLKTAIYEQARVNELRADMPGDMQMLEQCRLKYAVELCGNETIQNLFAMTPYYWKTSKEDFEKLSNMERLTTEIDILFSVYKKQTL